MVGTGIMAGICTSPYSSYPYPYSYPVNAGFPSKRRQIRTIPTGVGLFVISTSWEPMEELKMSLSPIEPWEQGCSPRESNVINITKGAIVEGEVVFITSIFYCYKNKTGYFFTYPLFIPSISTCTLTNFGIPVLPVQSLFQTVSSMEPLWWLLNLRRDYSDKVWWRPWWFVKVTRSGVSSFKVWKYIYLFISKYIFKFKFLFEGLIYILFSNLDHFL